jgi:hypothetical protein
MGKTGGFLEHPRREPGAFPGKDEMPAKVARMAGSIKACVINAALLGLPPSWWQSLDRLRPGRTDGMNRLFCFLIMALFA